MNSAATFGFMVKGFFNHPEIEVITQNLATVCMDGIGVMDALSDAALCADNTYDETIRDDEYEGVFAYDIAETMGVLMAEHVYNNVFFMTPPEIKEKVRLHLIASTDGIAKNEMENTKAAAMLENDQLAVERIMSEKP